MITKNNFKMKVVMGKQPYLQFSSAVSKQIIEHGATKLRLRHTFDGDTYISFFKEDNKAAEEDTYKLTKRTNIITVSSRKLTKEICQDFGVKFDENNKDKVSFNLIRNSKLDYDSLIEFEIKDVDFSSLIADENVNETEQLKESDVKTNVVDVERDTNGNIKSVTIEHTIEKTENEKHKELREDTFQFSIEKVNNGFILSNEKIKKVYEDVNNTITSILNRNIYDWIENIPWIQEDNFEVKITITEK